MFRNVILGETNGLTLNLPDTADAYTFKIGNVNKAVIDNNGINSALINLATSISANGYYRLPGNQLILQWGSLAVTDDQYTAVSYPTAYTTQVYSVVATVRVDSAVGGTGVASAHVGSITLTGFSAGVSASGGSPYRVQWMALGV